MADDDAMISTDSGMERIHHSRVENDGVAVNGGVCYERAVR